MTTVIMNSTASIDANVRKVGNNGTVVLRAGTYKQTLSPGGAQRSERLVNLVSYPGETVIIDGTGQGANALYTNSWKVQGIWFANFASKNNGVIAQVGTPSNSSGLRLVNLRFINCTTAGDTTAHNIYVSDPGTFYASGIESDRAAGSVIQFYTVPSLTYATVTDLSAANADQAIMLWDTNTNLTVTQSLFAACRVPIRGHIGTLNSQGNTGLNSGVPVYDGAKITEANCNWSVRA